MAIGHLKDGSFSALNVQSLGLVAMATQSFMPDMQALNPGRIQQNSPASQPQSTQGATSIVESSQQSQQSPISRTQSQVSTSQSASVQTVVSVTQSQQQLQASQGSSTPATAAVTQVSVPVVHSPSQQQQSQSQQQSGTVVSTPGTPQFITVAVSEENQNQGTVTLQSAQPVHPAYVQYVDGSGDAALYSAANGQMTAYSVYNVTDSSTMYTPATASYYNTGSGTPSTYSQVSSNVNQGSVGVGIQGQILAHQGGGTYLVQGSSLDGEGHSLIHTTRASPATESGGYKVQNEMMDGETHHNLATASATATHTTRISPVTEDPRKVTDIISHYSNDQCVIQTLHSSHDNTQLQLPPQQPQPQPQPDHSPSSHHSQHQNVRDMDIIHVQWLIDNYETAEGVSLPRSTLYNHYLRHCAEHKLEPVNAASFGKLIRSVFLGLRTRRLGTRGNSKYHYYGIRVKPNSPLNQITDDVTTALRQQPLGQTKRLKPNNSTKSDNSDGNSTSSSSVTSQTAEGLHNQQPQQQHQQFLGDASAAIPNFIDIDFETSSLSDGINQDDLLEFRNLYREHCEAFLDAVVNLQFCMVETLWQTFWRTQNSHGQNEYEKLLSKSKLYLLCKCEPVQQFVRRADYQFYQNLVDVLIPDVLRPIPSSLTQAIRNFAKSLEGWLASSMIGCPEEMIRVKLSAVSAFAQTLRRYTSLNHLAQAARAVLQNTSQINQMLSDLNRVDFHNVQEQASWVCQCEDNMVQRLEQDFKLTLQQQNSLEQWAAWLEGVVAVVLQPYEGKPDFPKAARQFLLKWSFYSSMVIRDLTLRSAASFGSFHLIRLLYDEYMFYLIEHCVAKAIGETPIAVMGEFIGLGTKLRCGKDAPLSIQKNLVTPSSTHSTKIIVENGSSMDSNCSNVPHSSSFIGSCSNITITNGIKDTVTKLNAALQPGLIGQPQVTIASNMLEAVEGEGVLQSAKKLKVT
ncbi:transcription factor RFX3-like isoform X3 [Centruroides vittatus]|uniref:transcription factor RFX3-like isoform X3 n=1 Tax=Centruroides vittatus TaxID=120091 RepID=UPI00351056A0